MLYFNPQKQRFEMRGANGQIVLIVPLDPNADHSDVPDAQVGVATPSMLANARKYLAGDETAGDALEEELTTFNTPQPKHQAPATQAATDQGGLLPSPQYLNEILNGIQTAVDLEDARQKMNREEAKVNRELQRRGLPLPAMTAPDAGLVGQLPTTPEAISELAATNPQYLAVFNRLGSMPAAIELMRRGNVLAAAVDQIDVHDREQTVHDRVSQLTQAMSDLDFERQEMLADASDTGEGARVKMDAFDRRYQRDYARLSRERDNEIEKVRPGWTAWQDEGMRNAIAQMPEGQRYQFSPEQRHTPGFTIQLAPTDRTDPLNPDQKQPVFPTTPGFRAQTAPQMTQTPSSEGPPYPAPAGQQWVRENGAWVLRPREEQTGEAGGAREGMGFGAGSAIAGLARFAEGGMFGGSAFGGQGSTWSPPPAAGFAPGTGQPSGYTTPEVPGASRGPLWGSQEIEDMIQEIRRGAQLERDAIIANHKQRMAALFAERGLGPMGAVANTGEATYPGQAMALPGVV